MADLDNNGTDLGGRERESWSNKLGFIFAATGSAIGLGNIWRFPYVAGENGGAAFLLIYILAILLIGLPVMVCEMTLGRRTQRNPVGAFRRLAPNTPWWLVGALGVITGFVILSFYSVVAGWSLSYVVKAMVGTFTAGMDFEGMFITHVQSPSEVVGWHGVFILLTILIISAGVVKGIQKWVEFLMPVLFILLLVLIVRGVTLEGAGAGLEFYLSPDFSEITAQTLLDAISQAFFTLSLGMGAILTYGSYLRKRENIPVDAGAVVGLDTLIAIVAGFAIFPAVFAMGLDPQSGPNLTFITLPAVFAEMPLGNLFGFFFFLLLSIAALTSGISLLEVVVAYLIDERGWERSKAAITIGGLIFLFGIPPVLGYSTFSGFSFMEMDILDTYDWLTSSIFLPLGGLLTALFVGHVWGARQSVEEARKGVGRFYFESSYIFVLKWVVPLVIAAIMIAGIWQSFSQ